MIVNKMFGSNEMVIRKTVVLVEKNSQCAEIEYLKCHDINV